MPLLLARGVHKHQLHLEMGFLYVGVLQLPLKIEAISIDVCSRNCLFVSGTIFKDHFYPSVVRKNEAPLKNIYIYSSVGSSTSLKLKQGDRVAHELMLNMLSNSVVSYVLNHVLLRHCAF
jgi:hypothetical protein